jgi:hypothetical protein
MRQPVCQPLRCLLWRCAEGLHTLAVSSLPRHSLYNNIRTPSQVRYDTDMNSLFDWKPQLPHLACAHEAAMLTVVRPIVTPARSLTGPQPDQPMLPVCMHRPPSGQRGRHLLPLQGGDRAQVGGRQEHEGEAQGNQRDLLPIPYRVEGWSPRTQIAVQVVERHVESTAQWS